jgi:hypothetical protein
MQPALILNKSSVWRIGVKKSSCGGCASAEEGKILPQFTRKNNTDSDDVSSDSII